VVRASYKDNSKKISEAIRRAPKNLKIEMIAAMERHALFFEGEVLKGFARGNRIGPFRRTASATKLGIRSGTLSRSLRHKIIGKNGRKLSSLRLRMTVGNSRTPYARIVHDGGTIRARPGGALAVPLPDNLTPAGNVRFKKLRNVSNTFITTSKAGNAIIARKVGRGKKKKLQYLAILKDEVTLRPRPYFVNVFNSPKVRADGERRFLSAANRALRNIEGNRRG
jgi:hypothetical protein